MSSLIIREVVVKCPLVKCYNCIYSHPSVSDWFPLWIPKSANTKVPYIKWHSRIGPLYMSVTKYWWWWFLDNGILGDLIFWKTFNFSVQGYHYFNAQKIWGWFSRVKLLLKLSDPSKTDSTIIYCCIHCICCIRGCISLKYVLCLYLFMKKATVIIRHSL